MWDSIPTVYKKTQLILGRRDELLPPDDRHHHTTIRVKRNRQSRAPRYTKNFERLESTVEELVHSMVQPDDRKRRKRLQTQTRPNYLLDLST
jgi:hypothetical protein